jgi:transcriptional regulator with XRE-family HTH domain
MTKSNIINILKLGGSFMPTFGERLKKLREERQLSQSDLGKTFNLSQSTIAYYESGKKQPYPNMLEKFSDYFNVSVDYLLGRTEVRNQQSIVAPHRPGDPMADLPEEALKELETLRQYVINKYQKKPQD